MCTFETGGVLKKTKIFIRSKMYAYLLKMFFTWTLRL
jgi:hypothetical protein